MTLQRAGLAAMAGGAVSIAAAYSAALAGHPAGLAPWLMVVGIAGLALGAMALGAGGPGGARRLVVAGLLVVAGILITGLGVALSGGGESGALFLGLPKRAAAVVYGVGLLPALILPVVYAAWFKPPRR